MAEIKRHPAKFCYVRELLEGEFIQRPGWEMSSIRTVRGEFYKVNILGIAVLQENESMIKIDDGTGTLTVRDFTGSKIFNTFEVGDMVMIIGKPRVYEREIFLANEIARKVTDQTWVTFRKKILGPVRKRNEARPPVEKEASQPDKDDQKQEKLVDYYDQVIKLINDLDKGGGADIDEVIKELPDAKPIIDQLINIGEIYEIKQGRLKLM
ncbi:MAG: hypothetical protein H6502_02200 [Candidatus Woesearchaeota archaeon]|nr:MAG: hypothetical protein H6502_02200 [Candidatus Woesearchaeota archaeon]